MRLVFLGDIQGNFPALEAVLAEVRRKPVDAIYHAGNVVGLGPWPEEVIGLLREAGIEGVRGTHDERVATGYPLPVGQADDDSIQVAESMCAWTRDRLSHRDIEWLERQPHLRHLSSGRMRTALFNPHPVSPHLLAHDGQPDDFFREIGSYTNAHVNVFAGTRRPFWRVVDGRWYVNAGSVGFPADADGRPSYAQVELNGGAAVRIVRVDYDRAVTARGVRTSALPAAVLRLAGVS